MPNLGMLSGKPLPLRRRGNWVRDLFVWSTFTAVAFVAMLKFGQMYDDAHVNVVKLTYELRGVQTEEVKDERTFGYRGINNAFRFATLQNEQASSSARPLHKVVKLEYCPHEKPCQDWTPKRYRRVIEGWTRGE